MIRWSQVGGIALVVIGLITLLRIIIPFPVGAIILAVVLIGVGVLIIQAASRGPPVAGRGPMANGYRYFSSIAFCSSSARNSGAAMSMSARARCRIVLPYSTATPCSVTT